jgi:secreted trypsin-like serine protease
MKVQMGTTFRYGTKAAEDDTNRITRNVKKIHRHPDYEQGYIDRNTTRNKKGGYGGSDIAIITLADPMPFTRNIWPVCLGSKDMVPATANQRTNPLILSGFGQDKNRDVKNVKLQVSKQIRLLEEYKCEASIKDLRYEFKQGQVCTVGVKEENTAGACKGDSGGPLTQALRGRYYLLGVVSYGPGDCVKGSTTNPDVYTDVPYFKTWIDGTTNKWRYSTYFERSKISKINIKLNQHSVTFTINRTSKLTIFLSFIHGNVNSLQNAKMTMLSANISRAHQR